ncbi:MAG: hypothetical protein ACXV5L_12785, partial [Thermoanaerobaculia bacterium]
GEGAGGGDDVAGFDDGVHGVILMRAIASGGPAFVLRGFYRQCDDPYRVKLMTVVGDYGSS